MILYEVSCVDGGWGWGETGAQALMCAETETELKRRLPGGWVYKDCGETQETFYLKHILSERLEP